MELLVENIHIFAVCLVICTTQVTSSKQQVGRRPCETESLPRHLPKPENVTLPNAINTSITVQWQMPDTTTPEGDCAEDYDDGAVYPITDFNATFEIRYWLVNRIESMVFLNVSDGILIRDEYNRTYMRHDLDDLEARQYYSIQIRSITMITPESNQSATLWIHSSNWTQTFTRGAIDGVPDKPTNLTAEIITDNDITLTWDEPTNPNGDIIQYEVNYRMDPDSSEKSRPNMYFELRSDGRSTTITDLKDDTSYEFQVAAKTRHGVGLAAMLPVVTLSKNADNIALTLVMTMLSLFVLVGIVAAVFAYISLHSRKKGIGNNDKHDIMNNKDTLISEVNYGTYTSGSSNDRVIWPSPPPPTTRWDISLDQLQFNRALTMSNHNGCVVFKGEFRNLRHGHRTAVVIKTCYGCANPDVRDRLENESKTLRVIGEHTNVVQLIGSCEQAGTFYEVLEYFQSDTLHDFLRESGRNVRNMRETMLDIAIYIAQGMEYIAQQKIVHRDLSTDNILIGYNMTVKIKGFGFATRPGDAPVNNIVTILTNWRPKSLESLCYGIHTTEGDVWSYGVILWEIACPGKTPFNANPYHKMKKLLIEGHRLPEPRQWHSGIYELMLQCWLKEPSERPSFRHLKTTLQALKKKKQFYPNLTMENITDSSLDLDDFDIVGSSDCSTQYA